MVSQQELVRLKKRIPEVVRTDATYVDRSIFLATHTPFKSLGYVSSGVTDSNKKTIDEEAFLRKHILENRNDHQFIIVQGNNGSGKSHFIRWTKERYTSQVSTDKEAVLFISRAQSTLRGALEQIIESDLFEESDLNDQLKKLIQANEHLSKSNLNKQIIAQFAIEASEDEDNESNIISRRHKKNLYSFLVDPLIQEFLFRTGGPIERVKLRLNAEVSNQRLDDISPRFCATDFEIPISKVSDLREQQVNRLTLKLAENLSDLKEGAPEVRQQVAEYLNQFLESVVQKCTNLRGADLEEVFKKLRRELKSRGKNLTLFIEDITSFTGIDRALVEVLITEHRETEFCRICSIVGITNEYYNNSIPGNIKDRVTGRLLLDAAFLTNDDEIAEMAARYLNAMYMDNEELEQWVVKGADDYDLPITRKYNQQKWSTITLSDDKELTLFPFNKRALTKLYQSIEPRTPRMFLKLVLSKMLSEYCNKMELNEFPPLIRDLNLEYKSLPQWVTPLAHQIVERQSQNHSERLATFIRIWGDQTLIRSDREGYVTVGGMPEEAFKVFGLPFIEGQTESSQRSTSDPINDGSNRKAQPSTSPINNKNGIENNRVKEVAKPYKTAGEINFSKLEQELELWRNNGRLDSYKLLKENVFKVILDFIDWESENVPGNIVKEYLNRPGQIEIEGQGSKQQINTSILIKRNNDSYNAFLAIGAWYYLGNKSWVFSESTNYLSLLYNWLNQIKKIIVQSFKYPGDINKDESTWNLRQWSIASSFYSHVIGGSSELITKNYSAIYQQLFAPIPEIEIEDYRSEEWKGMQKRLNQADPSKWMKLSHELLCELDNRMQVSITATSRVYFLDAVEIIRDLKDLIKKKWDIENIKIPEIETSKNDRQIFAPCFLLKEYQKILPQLLMSESNYICQVYDDLLLYFDGGTIEEQLPLLLTEIKNLLEYFKDNNIGFKSENFKILSSKSNRVQLDKSLKAVEKLKQTDQPLKQLRELVKQPSEIISQYINLCMNMEQLIKSTESRFNQTREILQLQESSIQVTSIITTTKEEFIKIKKDIEELQGGR